MPLTVQLLILLFKRLIILVQFYGVHYFDNFLNENCTWYRQRKV